jgi:Delta7-sterol 5-desaturase
MDIKFLTSNKDFEVIFLVILMRYLILASVAFFIFYVWKKGSASWKKIQTRFPERKDYFREISYSVGTAVIFAGIGFVVFVTPLVKYTQAYFKIEQYGLGYFLLSIVLMILVHDTYFYWTHRFMHSKPIYRFVHKVHHLSINPSPWAAMSFHPLESVIEGSVIALIAFLFPVHPLAIAIFLLFMMIYNVYGHLGYELYPKGFSTSKVGRWINTSVNHNMHHQYFTGNYGLYFLWWDRWMGTLHPEYDKRFEETKSPATNQTTAVSTSPDGDDFAPIKTSRTV